MESGDAVNARENTHCLTFKLLSEYSFLAVIGEFLGEALGEALGLPAWKGE